MGSAMSGEQAAAAAGAETVAAAATPATEAEPAGKTVATQTATLLKASPKKQKATQKVEAAAGKRPLPPGEIMVQRAPAEGPLPPGEVKAEGGKKEQRQTAAAVSNKLCVKNLPDDTTSRSLKAMFAAHGTVSEAQAKLKDGKCRGFGFVTFSSSGEAAKAMAALSGKMICGKELLFVVVDKKDKDTGKGKSKDKGAGGKGAEKGTGKGKDGKGKGKGKEVALAEEVSPPTAAPMPQASPHPYSTDSAYMQAYYEQYQPYVQQQYYNTYGMGYAQHQYMNYQ